MVNRDSLSKEEMRWLKGVQANPRRHIGTLVHICEQVLRDEENEDAALPKRRVFWECLHTVLQSYEVAPKTMGRRGGLKGGPARAAALSSARRSEIAKIAAAKRWGTKIEISPVEVV